MDPQQFQALPNSTNAVESYNRFGKATHPEPLKIAMMATYKEDMVQCLEIMARRQGLSIDYTNFSEDARKKRSHQQNLARRKRFCREIDDPEGPPDSKRSFNPGL